MSDLVKNVVFLAMVALLRVLAEHVVRWRKRKEGRMRRRLPRRPRKSATTPSNDVARRAA